MAKNFQVLSRDLDRRLAALPNDEGAAIRARNRARLEQELAAQHPAAEAQPARAAAATLERREPPAFRPGALERGTR